MGGVVSGSTARGNGGRGFNIVALSKFGDDNVSSSNGLEDDCGGGICTVKKRFYFTKKEFDGGAALESCEPGFHMASLWEIFDTSSLAYDFRLGLVESDSGMGVQSNRSGWVRTGAFSNGELSAGYANCSAYTSDSDQQIGTIARLNLRQWDLERDQSQVAPWFGTQRACNEPFGVWCVEDP